MLIKMMITIVITIKIKKIITRVIKMVNKMVITMLILTVCQPSVHLCFDLKGKSYLNEGVLAVKMVIIMIIMKMFSMAMIKC